MTLVVVDIDGSIADWKPRDRAVGGNPGRAIMAKYREYVKKLMNNDLLAKDKPINGMLSLLRGLASREDVKLVYLTGRSKAHHLATYRWLLVNRFPEADLIMRGTKDWRKAATFKTEEVKKIAKNYSGLMAIEDEPEVVEALTGLGATVLQVHYKG